jgi:hypothetical protein
VGTITPRRMAVALEYGSALHRLIDQAVKAALYLARFVEESRQEHKETPESGDLSGGSDTSGVPDPKSAPEAV